MTTQAREAGVSIICDIELLCEAVPHTDMLSITGTNGKSTTTALIGHILAAYRPTVVGGNIGWPVLATNDPGQQGTYVLELSSYQLELTPSLQAKGAVLLNITPDHLDRHGDMDGYIAAKMKMFDGVAPGRKPVAVIAIDTPHTLKIADTLQERGDWTIVRISTQTKLTEGVYVAEGKLYEVHEGAPIEIMDLSTIATLRGVHNHENAACAYAITRHVYGYAPQDIAVRITSFEGLAHRQQTIRIINGIAYINDSKATNADAASKALACYKNIYWIAGGLPKDGGLSGVENLMDRVKHAFLIGQAAPEFSAWMTKFKVPHSMCGTIDEALAKAHLMAQDNRGEPGGAATVLLSPACASWDQFKSFEHRGDVFADLVNRLSENITPDMKQVRS